MKIPEVSVTLVPRLAYGRMVLILRMIVLRSLLLYWKNAT